MIAVVPFLNETNPPENVKIILETTCFDCHSNKTNYPWYNSITPVNYWLESHVNDGKKHLDFSKWSSYSLKRKEHKMDELHEEVAEGEMPLKSYTWTHADANLTAAQIAAVVSLGKKSTRRLPTTTQRKLVVKKHRTYYWCCMGSTQFFSSRLKNVAVD